MGWDVVLTSVVVSALVVGVVSLWDHERERKARREELLLTKAIELAARRTQLVRDIASANGVSAELKDDVNLAEVYYHWLDFLMREGKLPPQAAPRKMGS